MKQRFADPVERQKQSNRLIEYYKDPKIKEAVSIRIKTKYETDPNYR